MNNLEFRILVVDDNPAILQDFIKILKNSKKSIEFNEFEAALFGNEQPKSENILPNFLIDTASQGLEGVDKIKSSMEEGNPYALAFVDVRMPPGIDGIQAIKKIWALDPDIQIVICTAYSDYSWEETIDNLGVNDNLMVIKKPFDVLAVRQMTTALTRKWILAKESKKHEVALENTIGERTKSLEQSLALLRATIESSSDGILVTDLQGKIIDYNSHFVALWGIPQPLLELKKESKLFEYMTSEVLNPALFLKKIKANRYKTIGLTSQVIQLVNGRVLECASKPHRVDSKIVGKVWSFRDTTEQVNLKQKLEYQATHDALTELPNRTLLIDRLNHAIKSAIRHKTKIAILFFDLDRFKAINDGLSHEVGDGLLRAVAQRLSSIIRSEDTLSRLGGDEFVLVFPSIEKEEYVVNLANKIMLSFKEPFNVKTHEFSMSASIGVSIYPTDGNDINTLLSKADLAMYRAKARGGNQFIFYSKELDEIVYTELELRRAIAQNEFFLEYQPQFDMGSKELLSVEALIRWQHPEKGLITPLDFLPLIEISGLIIPIGEWVIKEVCKQINIWRQEKLPFIRVAINVATKQLKQPDFANTVQAILKEHEIPPEYIELEITENVFVDAEIQDMVLKLSDVGVNIVLDDFGTGSTSLSSLKQLPLTRLKIDKSFVSNISRSRGDEVIIEAIIAIARSLKYKVLAEGVETNGQFDFLKKRHCDEVQGFLLSKPLPPDELKKFFDSYVNKSGGT